MMRLREEARVRRVAAVLQHMPREAREAALLALDALRRAADDVETNPRPPEA
jgi:hypothetical protein